MARQVFDGDGCIVVNHNVRVGPFTLELNITQEKSLAVLAVDKILYQGEQKTTPIGCFESLKKQFSPCTGPRASTVGSKAEVDYIVAAHVFG